MYSNTHTQQVFKAKNLTRTIVKNNILRIWNLTNESERHDWYGEANEYALKMSFKTPFSQSQICGIIAALSPVKTWEQNLICVEEMIFTGDCGHMKVFKKKASDIMTCDGSDDAILKILNGNKICSFFLNIKYPESASNVTIDRHALSIALGYWTNDTDYQGMTTKQYEFFVQCYIAAAVSVGVAPLLMQSATWVKWRKIKSLKEYKKA